MTYDYLIKYIIIGDTGVGKSSLLLKFTDNRFTSSHDITIGVEFGSKSFEVGKATTSTGQTLNTPLIKKKQVKINVWDTAGQETFRALTRSYYRGAAVIFLVYDVTRRNTFINCRNWIKEIEINNNIDGRVIMLVANKTDQSHRRYVTPEEGHKFAKEHGMYFVETSAKKNSNVTFLFKEAARRVCQALPENENEIKPELHGVKLNQNKLIQLQLDQKRSLNPFSCCGRM